jgi:AAA family ATP:ADP antiporter
VSREAKYKTKSLIDTVLYRGGDTVGAWLNSAAAAVGLGPIGVIAVPMAAGWLGIAVWLARRHASAAQVKVSP